MCQSPFSELLRVADNLKIFHVMKSAEDCKLLQSDTDIVQKWYIENYIKINIQNYWVFGLFPFVQYYNN
jgi:hypothetical protein